MWVAARPAGLLPRVERQSLGAEQLQPAYARRRSAAASQPAADSCCYCRLPACLPADGQTGSGKTHTMMGSQQEPGMIPRAMNQVGAPAGLWHSTAWCCTQHAGLGAQHHAARLVARQPGLSEFRHAWGQVHVQQLVELPPACSAMPRLQVFAAAKELAAQGWRYEMRAAMLVSRSTSRGGVSRHGRLSCAFALKPKCSRLLPGGLPMPKCTFLYFLYCRRSTMKS